MKNFIVKWQAIIVGLGIIIITSIIISIFMSDSWHNRENYNPDFGGLLGGALGGIGTLIAVFISINQNQKSVDISNKNQHRPFLIIKNIHAEIIEYLSTQTIMDSVQQGTQVENRAETYEVDYIQPANMWSISFKQSSENPNTFVFPFKNCLLRIYIELENIGIGPVIECSVNFEFSKDNIVCNEILIPAISPSQCYTIPYDISFSDYFDNHIQQIEKYTNMRIALKYKTILSADFTQKISLASYTNDNHPYDIFISHCSSQK